MCVTLVFNVCFLNLLVLKTVSLFLRTRTEHDGIEQPSDDALDADAAGEHAFRRLERHAGVAVGDGQRG